MNSKDRKTIRLYIKKNPSVESFSKGDGLSRKVGIKSSKNIAAN
jgi:predicted RNA-binding protein Jag